MTVPSQRYVRNKLLAALDPADYEELQPALAPLALKRSDVLVTPGEPIPQVAFVEAGIVSSVANTVEGRRIEVGLVGREGFVGVPVLLGVGQTPHEGMVQLEGEALVLASADFRDFLGRRPAAVALLLRYAHTFQVQTAQTALSNGSYSLEERLARWLLMCHDRSGADEIGITHEFLSIMLGVRRPGVTTTLHILEGAGMIRSRRSRVEILSRQKLLDAAGDSYGVAENEYDRVIPAYR